MNTTMERTRDELADAAQSAADQASPKLQRARARAEEWAAQGAHRMRDLRDDVLDRADRVSSTTVGYVKDEPVKSLLMAAALGAAVALLARTLMRSRY